MNKEPYESFRTNPEFTLGYLAIGQDKLEHLHKMQLQATVDAMRSLFPHLIFSANEDNGPSGSESGLEHLSAKPPVDLSDS